MRRGWSHLPANLGASCLVNWRKESKMGLSITPQKPRGERRRAHLVADINVTPMVDVMLVLLVIFMVTAPLLTVGVPVDLPKTEASVMNEKDEPLTVTVDAKVVI